MVGGNYEIDILRQKLITIETECLNKNSEQRGRGRYSLTWNVDCQGKDIAQVWILTIPQRSTSWKVWLPAFLRDQTQWEKVRLSMPLWAWRPRPHSLPLASQQPWGEHTSSSWAPRTYCALTNPQQRGQLKSWAKTSLSRVLCHRHRKLMDWVFFRFSRIYCEIQCII